MLAQLVVSESRATLAIAMPSALTSRRFSQLLQHRALSPMRTVANALYHIPQTCYLVPELPYLPLQPMEQRAQSHARMSFAESRQRSTIVKGSAM